MVLVYFLQRVREVSFTTMKTLWRGFLISTDLKGFRHRQARSSKERSKTRSVPHINGAALLHCAATEPLSSRRAHFSSAFALWSRKDWRRNLIVFAFAGLSSVWHKQPQGDTKWSESGRAARRFALDPLPERFQAMRENGDESEKRNRMGRTTAMQVFFV